MIRIVIALLLLAPTRSAFGHSFEPALLDLREREAGVFDVLWRAPDQQSGTVLPGDPELVPVLPTHCRILGPLAASEAQPEARTVFRTDCGSRRLRGERIAVPGIAGSRVDAIVRITWNDGSAMTGVLRSDSEELIVPEQPSHDGLRLGAPTWVVARRFCALGVEHILRGYDHVLFVIGLFLLVHSTRALVATISAFTVAHSLTLAAAVLSLVAVPPAPVEALIAMSIVLLARELTRAPDEAPTVTRRYPWVVAFLFGLLHGLGFAGALAEIGIPSDQLPLALLAFNLGVEAGQLAIVLALAAGTAALLRQASPSPWLRRSVPAYAMGALAMAWTIERILRFWSSST